MCFFKLYMHQNSFSSGLRRLRPGSRWGSLQRANQHYNTPPPALDWIASWLAGGGIV